MIQIVDDALDTDLCRAAAQEWPALDWDWWNAVYESDHQRKAACNLWEAMPQPCGSLLRKMLAIDTNSLGLGRLIPDMSLWGGGLHSMRRGSILGLHLDADHHLYSGLHRLLNGILFLNPTWGREWGGNLEIWDAEKTRPVVQIAPVFNRLVLFATGDSTWHGVPQPLACPDDVQRMTLAVWWYAVDAPAEGKRPRAQFVGQA